MDPEAVDLLMRWLSQPPDPERCSTCGYETGDTPRGTPWPQHTVCPHCGADLVPF